MEMRMTIVSTKMVSCYMNFHLSRMCCSFICVVFMFTTRQVVLLRSFCFYSIIYFGSLFVCLMVFNATFNDISVITWR